MTLHPTFEEKKSGTHLAEIEVGSLETVKTIALRRVHMQEWLAISITVMIGILVAILIISIAMFPVRSANIKDIAGFTVGPLIGIYATVMGFYFGSKSKD